MRNHDFRNQIAEGQFTLPTVGIIALLLWLLSYGRGEMLWVTLFLTAVTAYVIVEWNNQCQLLRVRSRMNSVVFLTLLSSFPQLHTIGTGMIPVLCLVAAYFLLFKAYGSHEGQGHLFHAFLLISLASLFCPPLLLLIPFLLLSCNFQLRILLFKPFVASLLGLALPYWFYSAYTLAASSEIFGREMAAGAAWLPDSQWTAWRHYLTFEIPNSLHLPLWQVVATGAVGLLGAVAIIHFLQTSYNDKIRTRQYFYTILTQQIPLALILLAYPKDFKFIFPILILNLTPFIAHYFTLAKSRWMKWRFLFWIIIFTAIGIINYLEEFEILEFPALSLSFPHFPTP